MSHCKIALPSFCYCFEKKPLLIEIRLVSYFLNIFTCIGVSLYNSRLQSESSLWGILRKIRGVCVWGGNNQWQGFYFSEGATRLAERTNLYIKYFSNIDSCCYEKMVPTFTENMLFTIISELLLLLNKGNCS